MMQNRFGDILRSDLPNHCQIISRSDIVFHPVKYEGTFFNKKKKRFMGYRLFWANLWELVGEEGVGCTTLGTNDQIMLGGDFFPMKIFPNQ